MTKINCDGCGEQIEAKDALQCIGCKHNFCPECVDDDDMSIRTVVICGYCEAWGEGIVTDCEQRKQELIVAKIKAAMKILEQSPCGAIGKFGFSRTALKRDINMPYPIMQYHVDQAAWLELNELLEAIT